MIDEARKKGICEALGILVKNKTYICLVLALSLLWFVITDIQFWISNYYENVLGVSQQRVAIAFSVVCIFCPTSGAVVSGMICARCGGYES
jgi:Na+/melibiose symporter-like transporter